MQVGCAEPVGQAGEEHPHVAEDGDVHRLVQAEHLVVDVDLHHPLAVGAAPVGRLAPPVGLREPGPEAEDDVGLVARDVVQVGEDHRDGEVAAFVDHVARAPAGGDRRREQLGHLAQLVGRHRVQDAGAGVDQRRLSLDEHPRGGIDELGGGLHRSGPAVAHRRLERRGRLLDRRVHDVLGNRQVHHARPAAPRQPQRPAHQLRHAIERRNRAAPLRHRPDHAGLVEVLVGATAVGRHDLVAAPAGDEQDPVALAVLHGDTGKRVGRARAVACDRHAEPPGEPGVGAGHVDGRGLVPRRHQPDAVRPQPGVEPEVGPVDDAEDDLDALGCQHAGDHVPAGHCRHVGIKAPVGRAMVRTAGQDRGG